MTEEWRTIAGYEGRYDVSNRGRVRNAVNGRLRKIMVTRSRYPHVLLKTHGKPKNHPIHVLVAEAFLGPRPGGMDINHKDRNIENNWLDNLEYVTHSENLRHAWANGAFEGANMRRGENHPNAVITADIARMIRNSPERGSDLAARLGVTRSVVYDIRQGRRWVSAV